MKILLLLALAAYEMPPSMEDHGKIGCSIAEITVDHQTGSSWHTHVWVEFPDHKWTRLFSIRETRKAAMADCDSWMEELRKAVKRAK